MAAPPILSDASHFQGPTMDTIGTIHDVSVVVFFVCFIGLAIGIPVMLWRDRHR